MNEKIIDFQKFLESNKDRILATTLKNPTIEEFDEGDPDNVWDTLDHDLKEN